MASNKVENFVVLFVKRNAIKRGPTSSEAWNDTMEEISHDLTELSQQWNNRLVPLLDTLPNGSEGLLANAVDAWTDGLDGTTIFADSDATATLNSAYFNLTADRANTILEQFQNVYLTITSTREDLEDQIVTAVPAAAQIAIVDTASLYTATNVETALAEVMTKSDLALSAAGGTLNTPGTINNLDVVPTSVAYNGRWYQHDIDGSAVEYAGLYMRMDHSSNDNVLGLYMEVDSSQSLVGGSATKVIHKGKGDAHYVAIMGDGTSGYGYEAAMFGGDQGGDVDKQENGFLASLQGGGGFAASRKKQSNSCGFVWLVHDDGSDPTSPDLWATNYGGFYAINSLSNAFRVRCSEFALENPQIAVSTSGLVNKFAVYTSGDTYLIGDPATAGATTKNSNNLFLKGWYWTGGASTGTQSRLVSKTEDTSGNSSLYIYCGPTAGDTLIGYFSNIADGSNPGLNLQNNVLKAVSTITFETDPASLLDMQSGYVSNVAYMTTTGGSTFNDTPTFTGNTMRLVTARTIAAATDAGNQGDICWDADYIYVCVSGNAWKRAALSTW